MLKKIALGFIGVLACVHSSSYAINTHVLQSGVTMEYDFPSNEPQKFVNYLFWAVTANCVLTSVDDLIGLDIEVLYKKISINDVPYTSGNSISMQMHSGETLKLNVDAGAKAQITNIQNNVVHAVCTSK